LEYFHDAAPPPEGKGTAEARWWSPEPQRLQSGKEDEEENQYLISLLTGGLETYYYSNFLLQDFRHFRYIIYVKVQ
jgi:hypothetical protein